MNGFNAPMLSRGCIVGRPRFVIVVSLFTGLLLSALATGAVAQTAVPGSEAAAQSTPQDTRSAADATDKRPRDLQSDLRALDRVLTLLKDKRARTELVTDIERLRTGTATTDDAGKVEAASSKGKAEEGLLGAVTHAVKTAGEKAPEALAAPLDQKMDEAASEMQEQLEACLLYTSPSPRDGLLSRMPSSA